MSNNHTMQDHDVPEFRPNVPAYLLHARTEFERYALEQDSIRGQQNEFIMRKVVESAHRVSVIDRAAREFTEKTEKEFRTMRETIQAFDKWQTILTSKWTVVSFVFCVIALPIGMLFLSAYIRHVFSK